MHEENSATSRLRYFSTWDTELNFEAEAGAVVRDLRFEYRLSRVERYRNPAVEEGESVSPMTKMSKYFQVVIFCL